MSDLVDPTEIETIVGIKRHDVYHYARAVSDEGGLGGTVFILHSQSCVDSTPDLRGCPFSLAIDRTEVRGFVLEELKQRPTCVELRRDPWWSQDDEDNVIAPMGWMRVS